METTTDTNVFNPGNVPAPLNIQQAASYLGVDVRWMRRAVFERRLPFYKVGRYVRFAPADLDEFLRRARIEPRAR